MRSLSRCPVPRSTERARRSWELCRVAYNYGSSVLAGTLHGGRAPIVHHHVAFAVGGTGVGGLGGVAEFATDFDLCDRPLFGWARLIGLVIDQEWIKMGFVPNLVSPIGVRRLELLAARRGDCDVVMLLTAIRTIVRTVFKIDIYLSTREELIGAGRVIVGPDLKAVHGPAFVSVIRRLVIIGIQIESVNRRYFQGTSRHDDPVIIASSGVNVLRQMASSGMNVLEPKVDSAQRRRNHNPCRERNDNTLIFHMLPPCHDASTNAL